MSGAMIGPTDTRAALSLLCATAVLNFQPRQQMTMLMTANLSPQVAEEKRWGKKAAGAKGLPLFGRSKLVQAIMQQEFDRGTDVLFTL